MVSDPTQSAGAEATHSWTRIIEHRKDVVLQVADQAGAAQSHPLTLHLVGRGRNIVDRSDAVGPTAPDGTMRGGGVGETPLCDFSQRIASGTTDEVVRRFHIAVDVPDLLEPEARMGSSGGMIVLFDVVDIRLPCAEDRTHAGGLPGCFCCLLGGVPIITVSATLSCLAAEMLTCFRWCLG